MKNNKISFEDAIQMLRQKAIADYQKQEAKPKAKINKTK